MKVGYINITLVKMEGKHILKVIIQIIHLQV